MVKMHSSGWGKSRIHNDELLGTVRIEQADGQKIEEQIIALLKKVIERQDSRENILGKVNDIVMLQPNFAGIGLNINAIIEKLMRYMHK